MIKLTFCLRRHPSLDREQFQTYWRETHAPLVRARAETLGIRRYVQCHTADLDGLHRALQERNNDSPEPFDGVAELWFDDLETVVAGEGDAASAAAELLADEQEFIDLANSPLFLVHEHEIVADHETA